MRAWRALPGFEGRSSLRSWLYRIVTNTSLDEIHRRPRRVVPIDLDDVPSATHWHTEDPEPATERRYLSREDFERAWSSPCASFLRVSGRCSFSARRSTSQRGRPPPRLGTSVAAANSLLQRARTRLEGLDDHVIENTTRSLEDGRLRELVDRHAEAWERNDVERLVGMLAEEVAVRA